MNSEFNWWLLILGAVIGAGLVWLVLADSRRRESDVAEAEREREARWIGEAMRDAGRRVSDADALDVLRLHEAYLAAPPPDDVGEPADLGDEALTAAVPGMTHERGGGAGGGETRAPMAHPMRTADSTEPARRLDG